MVRYFTFEYWIDDGWYVGRLREVPGVFSQGASLQELEDNIRDAYRLMMEEEEEVLPRVGVQTMELEVPKLRVLSGREGGSDICPLKTFTTTPLGMPSSKMDGQSHMTLWYSNGVSKICMLTWALSNSWQPRRKGAR